ncbi:MAG: hypothetical protein IJS90_04785 [Clostridia bacterium]|nr:hypothetical protein [Clostridia bacterium]
MKSKLRSVLCVILSAALVLCIFSTAGAAEAKRYVVLGDSIAFGLGLLNPGEAVYGKIVADTNGYEYENYAIPGHTTANMMQRMENKTVKNAIANADIISISIGGNNFLMDDLAGILFEGIVKEDYTHIDEIADKYYDDLDTIIRTIRELNAHTAILLQTIYNPQTSYIGEVYKIGAERINGKMKEYAANNPGEIIIVDVAARLTDSGTDFAEDRVHPSAAGNEKIAEEVLKTLYENGLGTETEPVINTPAIDLKGTAILPVVMSFYGSFLHMLSLIRGCFTKF